jgi:LacI family transcriptional regulator
VEAIADPFFAEVIDTVEAEMARHGRSVLVASTRRDPAQEQAVIKRMLQRRVAGLLVAPTCRDNASLRTTTTPIVLVDRGLPDSPSDLVDIDDRRAAFEAVNHLIGHGHHHIAYIGDNAAIPTSAARLRGYHDALHAHGIDVEGHLVISTAATSREAARATNALLDAAGADAVNSPTALFCATTRASVGAVPVLHARRRTDLAFVGLGDFAMAEALEPGVTVIDHSGERVGQAAAERLLARLADPELPIEHIRLAAPLIPRGSGELRPC